MGQHPLNLALRFFLEMAALVGMTNLAPVDDNFVTTFKPVPTKK